ncbi:MAG: DHH family phosphoesterase [Oscillospiraceae bacterium]|nr:DHH family phosphoesterase [Oscillospiraceae bacterium]
MQTAREVAAFLLANDDYLIVTHRRPDGDAVGSAAALCRALRSVGKRAELFPNPQFLPRFLPLTDGLCGAGDARGKTVITVDTATEKLFPYNAQYLLGKVQLAIDHHGSHTPYAAQSWIVPDAAACGELMPELCEALGAPFTDEIATAVYVAVSTDTGCFRYTNTTAKTFRVAAQCREAGAACDYWNRVLFLEKSRNRLDLEAYLIATAEFYADGSVCFCALPREKIKELGVSEDELDDISGFPRDIAGVQIGAMFRDVNDGAKISLRTYAPYDASAICAELGGGGHPAAAGATVPGTITDAKKALCEALRKHGVQI